MKKSDELRLKTRKLIAKNLIVLVALVVVAIVGAFSWFSQTTTASAGSLTAKTKISDALEYYIMPPKNSNGGQVDQYNDINTRLSANATYNQQNPNAEQRNTKWHIGELTFDSSDPEFAFMEDLFLCETTSDGKTFKLPGMVQYGEVACVDPDAEFNDALANENYLSFDLYFRCRTANRTVVMTNDSIITPTNTSTLDGTTYDTTNAANEEDIKPAAVGAARLSVLNASNQRQILWIPAPNVWFDGINNRLYTGLSSSQFSGKGHIITDGQTTTSEGTNNHYYYDESNGGTIINSGDLNAEGAVVASDYCDYKFRDRNYIEDDGVSVVTLNQHDSVNGYYYGHVRVNLWLEGEDAEARLKMVGGKFNMTLCFDVDES